MSHNHETACGCGCGCHSHEDTHGESGLRAWLPLVIGGVLFISGLIVPTIFSWQPMWQGVWMAAAAVMPLVEVMQAAMNEWRRRSLGENTLLVIAVVAAFLIREWVEGALVLLLFQLGEQLEDLAMDRSRKSISALAAISPDTAWRLDAAGDTQEIPAQEVRAGDVLRVYPHHRVPVDGEVLTGESMLDTAAITGESVPRYVTVGDTVLSGTVNGNGMLTIRAQAEAEHSAAARILHMVEDAAAHKGQSEKFITRFARIYTPAVTVLAVLVAVLPPLLGGGWTDWLHRALVFLVASCPCALVISIPLSFYAGVAAAARQGVLLKGGRHVEALAGVKAIAFDKTGTLTTDKLTVTRVVTGEGIEKSTALQLAAALEKNSAHPLAGAICAAAGECDLPDVVTDLQELPGLGVTAAVEGHTAACGGGRLLERLGVTADGFPAAPVYVVLDNQVIAAVSVAAQLQEGAAEAIGALKKLGIRRFLLLSGDRQEEVDAVSRAVDIGGEVFGDLLPEDKLSAVRDVQEAGFATAFVGDGINDAPVLAQADVGLAMGLGSPAAMETADGVLVSGGLSRLPLAVRLSRRVMRTVRTNIAFALAVKLLVLILAVAGIAPMWLAVFADVGVTLLSVFNAVCLLLHKA